MNELALIFGMFVVTFGIRYLMFAFANNTKFPAWLESALSFVPPAVLTAIVVPAVLIPGGEEIEFQLQNPYLTAAIFSFFVAVVTKNLLKTIAFGLLFFLVLKWLI